MQGSISKIFSCTFTSYLKIFNQGNIKKILEEDHQLGNYDDVCQTAPATMSLLFTKVSWIIWIMKLDSVAP